jgi:hypothetical protein
MQKLIYSSNTFNPKTENCKISTIQSYIDKRRNNQNFILKHCHVLNLRYSILSASQLSAIQPNLSR